jgi:leucyl aminopeptidase
MAFASRAGLPKGLPTPMKITVTSGKPEAVSADALVLSLHSDGDLPAAARSIDKSLNGIVTDLRRSNEFKGRRGEETVVPISGGLPAKRLILVGLGPQAEFAPSALTAAVGGGVRAAARRGLTSIAFALPELKSADLEAAGELAAEGAVMATFDPASYRSKRETRTDAVKSVTLVAAKAGAVRALKSGVHRGVILGDAANIARRLVNTPSNDMTPTEMAKRAKEIAKEFGMKFHVLERADMKKLGMGSMLSVAAGSDEPPKMIAMEYRGDKKSKDVLGLVGKGITFDTGGISLKPAQDMDAMKGDMAGGATVIAAMAAIAQLKPKVNVTAVICATENMPSGKATKPGDVVRAMNGKSIEVINTDAEGRLVLADGLCYAQKLGATRLVDIATLTGAVVVALGNTTTGVLSNDRAFVDAFHAAADRYDERYWELPLYPEYADLIRSPIADMKNSGGRPAGTIFGAMFIKEFVDDRPWIHLDIAGTSTTDKDHGHLAKGPTGVALRPLVRLAELLPSRRLNGKADEKAHARFRRS